MAHEIVDNPAPLTPQTAYPFAIVAFPVRDLVASGVIRAAAVAENAIVPPTASPLNLGPLHWEP